MPKIGIIGGAGVAATNKLNELIELELTKNGAFRDSHHPEIIVWQATQVPSRSLYLEGKGKSFIPEYIDIAKKLKYCGADKICMCCNTAHYAIEEISYKARIPFINLIDNIAFKVKRLGIKNVGLIASDGCLKGKVYEKYFDKICPEVKIVYPNKQYQSLVTKGICNIKNMHRFDDLNSKQNPSLIFKQVENYLINKGVEKIIVGCTDIRVSYYNEQNIDSLEILKDLIVKETKIN